MNDWNRRRRPENRPVGDRVAGQGAREKANELAARHPIKTFFSKLTFDIFPTKERAWRIGAEHEEQVGEVLKDLPREWCVRHDVLLARNWNADHIVAGPPGVFVLDTKYRSGEVRSGRRGIRVDGYRTDMAAQARKQARHIFGCLKERAGLRTWVQPTLVFGNDIAGRAEPNGVHVVGIDELVDYLLDLPRELDRQMLGRVGEAIRDDSTWRYDRRRDRR